MKYVFALFALVAVLLVAQNGSSRAPVPAPVFKAVRHYWKTRPDRVTAFDVIACETGDTYSTTIGSYRVGLFQFGPWERSQFGYGWSVWAQARGAHNYWRVSGWSPWKNYEPAGCGA